MTMTPTMLLADQQLREMLTAFDFTPEDNHSHGPVWADIAPMEPFEIVAQRGTGCVFALVGPQRCVLLLTSEGQSGVVAANLQEYVELVVAHPQWWEVARHSGGKLAEMRRIFRDDPEGLQDEFFDHEQDIDELRLLLRERLKPGIPKDPGFSLHRALTVLNRDVVQCDPDGRRFEPLFDWLPAK